MEKSMNYIILDMEWNQPYNMRYAVKEPVLLHGEIVQIGAVKLDESFQTIDKIDIFIRPKHYKRMNKRISQLTGITNVDLKSGIPFTDAYEIFREWCGEESVLLTWGPDDLPMLIENITVWGLDASTLPKSYNLQVIFDAQIAHGHRQFALNSALEMVGEIGKDAHNALNDAENTALVCTHLDLKNGIESYDSIKESTLSGECSAKKYPSRVSALKDEELILFECPECKNKVSCVGIVNQNQEKTLAHAKCECGKEFFIRFKFRRIDGQVAVSRVIYDMTDERREYYEEKRRLAHNRRRRRLRKK